MTPDEKRADLAQKIASMTEKQFQEFRRLLNEEIKSGMIQSSAFKQEVRHA